MKIIKLTTAMILFILSVVGLSIILIFIACATAPMEALPTQDIAVEEEDDRSYLWVNGKGRLVQVQIQKVFS